MADKITTDELQSICNNFLRTAMGSPESEVGVVRDRNIRAYNAQPVQEFAPPEIEDRSQYVSQDVAEVVDGMLPQLLDVFVSDDSALTCTQTKPDVPPDPNKPGDQGISYKAQAKAATTYLNYVFYTKNDGLNVLYDWIHDALLQKVGFVKVWLDEEAQDTRQTFSGLTQEQLDALQGDGYEFEGKPQQQPDGTFSVVAGQHGTRKVIKTAAVPPHQMRIDSNARWGAAPNAIGSVEMLPRFQLEEMGYDVLELAGIGANINDEIYNVEASDMLGEVQGDANADSVHESYMLYSYAELYLKLDVNGDGVAEWNQCCLINGIIVHSEEVDDHPFADMCLMPRPHAYFGDCPADRSYDVQKEHTNLARALLDNTYLSVNGRTYVNTDADVNIDDLLDSRPGGVVRGRGDPRAAILPLSTPNLTQPAFELGEWLQSQLENRTGFTRYSQGMDGESLNKTAHGIDVITQKSDMRLRLMSRFAAAGIRTMFRKILKLATQNQVPKEWLQINGAFAAIDPSEWKDQFNLTINVGLGHGTKQQQAQRVMAMLPLQMQGLQLGIVGPQQIANTIRLFATLNEFKNPDDFVMPEGAQPGQPVPPMQAMQQHLQQLQQQLQQLGQQNQMLQLQNANKQGELSLKAQELQIKAQEAGANIAHKAHGSVLSDAKAQHEQAAAAIDNAAAAHNLGVNMGLASAEKSWLLQQAAAHQIADAGNGQA